MKQVIAAGQRQHFSLFLKGVFKILKPAEPPLETAWYLRAISHAMVDTANKQGGRLVINVPPRHLKSIAAAVALPAFLLGRDPTRQIMVATYGEELARPHSRDFRQIMTSPWYQELFPGTRIADGENRITDVSTTRLGGRRAVTVGGAVTGHGADVIIVDDCMKAEDARSPAKREELKLWFDGSLATRQNLLGAGSIICIAQRLHEDDLPAHVLAKGWQHLSLPAIAERVEDIPIGHGQFHRREVGSLLGRSDYGRAMLEQERLTMGPVAFAAMYQQNPVLPGGNMIRLEWFGRYHEAFERHAFQRVVQCWDTAISDQPTADYSVCTTWGWRDGHWYLLDILRERLAFPDLKRAVPGCSLAESDARCSKQPSLTRMSWSAST